MRRHHGRQRRGGGRALVLAVLALTAAAAAGSTAAPAAEGDDAVTIYRDAYGIPHVESQTFEGVAYGTGYALAKDRLFLTLAIRLVSQGRSAELLGRDALEADRVMRRDFYDAADVQRQYEALSPDRRNELEAFTRGFNTGMNQVLLDPFRRPAAFDVLGYAPEPWKPTDSVAVTGLFTWVTFAGEGGAGQLRNAGLLARLVRKFGEERGLELWDDLLFKNDPAAPTVGRRNEGRRAPRSVLRERMPNRAQIDLALELNPELGGAAQQRAAEYGRVNEILKRLPVPRIGSYAAALSGRRTASGGAVVVGSPQAGLNAPPVFWQVGQHSPGRDCTGFTVPGLGPWTGIGWCNGHAWSLVAGNMGEQVDNYVERVDPDNPRRYRHNGEWREMTVRRETFQVNKCVPPVCSEAGLPGSETMEIESTVHGPVVARPAPGIAITQRRAQLGEWARALEAIAGWNTAGSMAQFERATVNARATYNLVYGDGDGHILYRFTGWQPVRARGVDRRLPAPGEGGAEWRGMLPQSQMPRVADPRSGVLVANQGVESKPARWWPNSSSVAIGQVTRVGWNRRILGRRGVDVAAMEALNPDLLERVDGITPVLAPHLRRALADAPDARLREAWALFEEWAAAGYPRIDRDGDGSYDHPAVMIFGADHFNLPGEDYPRVLWADLLDRVFADELGAPVGNEDRGSFQVPGGGFARLSLLKLALDGERASRPLSRDFADDLRTPERERGVDLIRVSTGKALEELERRFGTADMRHWLGPVPTMRFVPLGLTEPPSIRGFDHGTYSQIVDPRADAGRYILAPGNGSADGAPEIAAARAGRYPEHFTDQLEIYEDYGFIDMRHAPAQYRTDTESVERLSVP